MAGSRRQQGQYARDPLTYLTGASPATTPGEQTIAAQTTAPTVITDGFVIAPLDAELGSSQLAAPNALDIAVELSGSADAAAIVNFSIWFWMPDAATANKWRESGPFKACGVDVRGAKGADNVAEYANGNAYLIDCPQGATRGFVHVETLGANVNVHALVFPNN